MKTIFSWLALHTLQVCVARFGKEARKDEKNGEWSVAVSKNRVPKWDQLLARLSAPVEFRSH